MSGWYSCAIGRVSLLSADDEVVLARAVELAQWLVKVEGDIKGESELEVETVDPVITVSEILRRLGAAADTADYVAKYLGLGTPVKLSSIISDPTLRTVLDARREDELVNYLSDALGVEPDDAHKLLVELSGANHRRASDNGGAREPANQNQDRRRRRVAPRPTLLRLMHAQLAAIHGLEGSSWGIERLLPTW